MNIEIPVKVGDRRLVKPAYSDKWKEITVSTVSVIITYDKTYIFIYGDKSSESFDYYQSKAV